MLLDHPWQIPSSTLATGSCRVEYHLDAVRLEADVVDAGDVPFENCDPVREFPAWRGKRHHSGLLWMERTGRHVPFESLAERSCLIELDRTPGVALVASQPMWIRWDGENPEAHAPDYFVRFEDGAGMVVDVRPRARIDEKATRQFDRTAALCRDCGWDYAVYAPDSEVRDANMRFLMRFREEGWRSTEAESTVRGAAGTIESIARILDSHGDGLARCFSLIWTGHLAVDLDEPLSLRSAVWWKESQ